MTMPSEPTTQPATGQGDGTTQPQNAPQPQQQSQTPATGQAQQDAAYWQAEAEKWKGLSRQNEDRAKANKTAIDQQQAVLAQITKHLGIDVEGKPDAEQLQQTIASREGELKQSRIENAILRAAPKLNADMDALLDSRTFLSQLDELDPSDKTFAANVEKAIKAAIEANPRLKTQQSTEDAKKDGQEPPARNGAGDFNAAPGGHRQWTADDVAKATPDQLNKAIADGLLTNYLNS